MEENVKTIQDKLMSSLERLDKANKNIAEEVARSNAVSQLANTYIKACNLIIRVEDGKKQLKTKIGGVPVDEK